MPSRRAISRIVGVVGVAACGACSGLQFREDGRLTFMAPEAEQRVDLPVTVRWSMDGFEPTGLDGTTAKDHGVFAVFVDRAPMPVGRGVEWLARDDAACRSDPGCPDEVYLTDRGVYLRTSTSLRLDLLPSAAPGIGDEHHFVYVVLLDGAGVRVSESAWHLPFSTERRSS